MPTVKSGVVVLIHDVARHGHIEALPQVFDSIESVNNYAARRLNVLVTVIVSTSPVIVPGSFELFSFSAHQGST